MLLLAVVFGASNAALGSTNTSSAATNVASRFRSLEDGWLDVSGFLDEKYGFLPVVMPITEPAVGYGAAGGLAFISRPLGETNAGFGRPNISMIGGMGTENGSWGAVAGDVRHWLNDHLQTLVGVVYSSVNLDFHGIGQDSLLENDPLRYKLEPKGGLLQGKLRLSNSRAWIGLNYAWARTGVSFEAPAGTPGLPDFTSESAVSGFTPSFTYDSRDNIFTPTRGTFVEASVGIFGEALGGDDDFQRARLTVMQYVPLSGRLFLGLRGDASASFGNAPFYLRPFIYMRGLPIMRYQGEEIAQFEAELRWQFWKRFSLVGFAGVGAAWNDFERFDDTQRVVAGGTGFRYELARKYGLHVGLDVAFSKDEAAVYVQVGSAWVRP